MHASGIKPEEERLAVVLRLLNEFHSVAENFVVYRFHPLGTELSCVFNLLVADLPPARLNRGVINVRRPAMNHVAGADRLFRRWWIVGMAGVLHGIQMVEIPEELIEAVHRWQELVQIAEVVLAKLTGSIAHRLKN